ncbi:hypothetical protein KIKIMORA_03290 [Brevundimonas phage vB_BpoS-Kikimora]|uniref:Uncharacterized protein n=1 Tax=Brevundimonas phage vB_BpoS-Kikimora TaxID=2948601 RepID=A0A9E7MTP7_9CAUD|nr:hypothetical protein KIKIMORA_03290 [Brevundimonas phage vB_BpoS-Kikimora]
MQKTKTLEHLLFSSSDSGLTLRVLEKRPGWAPEQTDYRAEISHGAFGQNSVMSFPLGTPRMARYIAEALMRTADHMERQPLAGGKHSPFRRLEPSDVLQVRAGLTARRVYQKETISSRYSTTRTFLGLDWLDEDDQVVRFEPGRESASENGGGVHGSEPLYDESDIGLTVEQAKAVRRARGQSCEWLSRSLEVTTLDYRYVEPGADPEIIPVLDETQTIIDRLHPDLGTFEVRRLIQTFYRLPVIRKDPAARRVFAEAVSAKMNWSVEETQAAIRAAKA